MKAPLLLLPPFAAAFDPLYYRGPAAVGSEAGYTPMNWFVHYIADTVQVPASFDADRLDERFDEVARNLADPAAAVEAMGGWSEFVHRQIFPLKSGDIYSSKDMLPNYALHLLGGGMVFRKEAEWYAAHDFPSPWLMAALFGMTAEIAQEGLEKRPPNGTTRWPTSGCFVRRGCSCSPTSRPPAESRRRST